MFAVTHLQYGVYEKQKRIGMSFVIKRVMASTNDAKCGEGWRESGKREE
jgi:hypothetical protein